jgi:phosphoserine phosphatase RsbU/P
MPAPSRLVLIEGSGRRLDDVRSALRADSGVEVNIEGSERLWRDDAATEPAICLVDFDGLSLGERLKLTEQCVEKKQRDPIVLLAERPNRSTLVELISRHALKNLLARNESIDATDLRVTIAKLSGQPIFGLAQYFAAGTPRWSSTVGRASERVDCLSNFEAFAMSQSMPPRRFELLRMVADEFITNAIYDAPVDASGSPRFRHLQRNTDVELAEEERAQIEVLCDERRIGVSVTDPFGSLAPAQLFDYLARGLRKAADQIDQKEGGAGLGLYTAFTASSHLVVNIAPGKRTEMISILDHATSFRQYSSSQKSFNVFVA